MFAIAPIIIWAIFVFLIIKISTKGKSSTKNYTYNRPQASNPSASTRAPKISSQNKRDTTHSTSFSKNPVLMEDRKNDWLAKQIREEARIKSREDLGAAHDANCDARALKREHRREHNSLNPKY